MMQQIHVLQIVHCSKILPDALHTFNGEFNHFLQHVRLELREIDNESAFMQGMRAIEDAEKHLDKIATTKRRSSQVASKVAPIHSHSLKNGQEIKAQLKNINDLRDNREVLEE